jgi:hypothetical protein
MQRIFIVALPLVLGLSACETDLQRGAVGAAGGAVVAGAVGVDTVTGALIGGAAGYLCKDLNVMGCQQ